MSIADKLTTIAENTPKVYEAGYKKAVEELCPPINESGLVVQCCPLEGTELSVTWDEEIEQVHICGKNLFNASRYPLVENQIIRHASGTYASSSVFSATEEYVPCKHLQGQTISIRHAPRITENNISTGGGIAFYKADFSYLSGANTSQVTVPTDAVYLRFCINTDYAYEAQIELGSVTTKYERYTGKTVFVDGALMGETIKPIKGLNTIWLTGAEDEDIDVHHATVTGITDPKAEIDRLKKITGASSVATIKEE